MKTRTLLAATFTVAMSFLVVPSAHAEGGYNNGGSGAGLTSDDPATPAAVVPLLATPVAQAPAAAVSTGIQAAPAAAAPAAAAPAASSNVAVLAESIENIPTAAAAIATAPAAVASQTEISFTGANSLTMTGGAAALVLAGVGLTVAARRKNAAAGKRA